MHQAVLKTIFKDVVLSDHEMNMVGTKLKRVFVNKGDTISAAGHHMLYQFYVYQGCLRSFYLDNAGKQHTIQFAINNEWISDYGAFFSGTISTYYIECIQNAEIFKISKKSIQELYHEIPPIETFFRINLENFLVMFQHRICRQLSLTAKEQYYAFVKDFPQIERSVCNYHLASYLGITKESMSRIRKEMAQEH